MRTFNLVTEPCIKVIVDEKGRVEEVSLRDLFENSKKYIGLGGDSKTQDFAVLRFLLSILHTVYSRVDFDGMPYAGVELDERYLPVRWSPNRGYPEKLLLTWKNLWDNGKFTDSVVNYLEAWEDRFDLFDEEYPFYQITKEKFIEYVESDYKKNKNLVNPKSDTGRFYGRTLNRNISESKNKVSLFVSKSIDNKDVLDYPEIFRWLLAYQGYSGTLAKQIFRKKSKSETWSKGWIYDLGGLYFEGDNLFEILMLNFALKHPDESFVFTMERPLWEVPNAEITDKYLYENSVDNLSELYTNWSHAVYIDREQDFEKAFECIPIKLYEITHENQFLELMTIWKYDDSKGAEYFVPRKHQFNRSMWRSFGMIALPTSSLKNQEQKRPGIVEWFDEIEDFLEEDNITIVAISMQDDGEPASWVPVNEIFDMLNIEDFVLTDISESGWVLRINETVESTKTTIEKTYTNYLLDIEKIRFGEVDRSFANKKKEELYFRIDKPFRDWLSSIKLEDNMDEKVSDWQEVFKKILMEEARKTTRDGTTKDYRGTIEEKKGDEKGQFLNLPIAYNEFVKRLNRQYKGGKNV